MPTMVMRQAKISDMTRFYLLTALFLLFTSPLKADEGQERRVFSVYGVHVDVSSKTALEARSTALKTGARHAFISLVEKLIDSDSATFLTETSDALISSLIQSIEVVEEKTSTRRYIGDLNIGFSPEKVRQFFALKGYEYSEIEGDTHLVLPVLKHNGGYNLWADSNPWWSAWSVDETQNHLLRYNVPDRDFSDRMGTGAISLWSNDVPASADDLMTKYKANSVLIVRGEIKPHAVFDRQILAFSYRKDGASPLVGKGAIVALDNDTPEHMMKRAADAVRWRLDQQWKEQTRTDFAHSLALVAQCETHEADDLVVMRKALEGVSIIHNVGVEHVGVPVSEISLSFTGSLQQLQLALDQAKLTLSKRPTGSWFLSHRNDG